MNILTSLFRKSIDRRIEGVIKADDVELANLKQEVDEYVLTRNIENKLEDLLDAYHAKHSGGNGVWISGFFGSGKSHLLKMVALLLENKNLGDYGVIDAFVNKCSMDKASLKARLNSLKTPAKSILFNIANKSNIDNKKDTILEIFINVFNEACGYYGKSRDIAQFERELDEDGNFERFKKEFKNIAGLEWDVGRIRQRCRLDIDKAYNKVYGKVDEYKDVIEKTKETRITSIETFAELVKKYIDKQGPNFRINFLVDEVGQYIGKNVQYMLDLQSITEELGRVCNGRVCVIVTSQANITDFLKSMENDLSRNDFSRIQDRFETKIHLDSQDVEEVIQRRLLEKNDDAKQTLSNLYNKEVNNFKTLFDFTEGRQHNNFKNEEHFIDCYPFIPYQFTLFQNAMEELSRNDAFNGGYTSVGARSILTVFQQVAIKVSQSNQIGEIATFDMMYEGIRSSLKSIQAPIAIAEKNIDNPLAIKVLKALFLVKYIKSFKATKRNISVLMHSNFTENQTEYGKAIEEALNLLEEQTYIQRTNDVYEYLTDKEKDIEEEIKKTEISIDKIPEALQSFIFDGLIKQNKIHHANGIDYSFTRKLDGKSYSREFELSINVITPLCDEVKIGNIAMKSLENNKELFILLPDDKRLIDDIGLFEKTNKYINQKRTSGLDDSTNRIITDKQFQNAERKNRLQERIAFAISKSRFFMKSRELEILGNDATGCIIKAFSELVNNTYTGLRMLGGITYRQQEIDRIIQDGNILVSTNLSEAEQEVLNSVTRSGTYKTTVKNILDTFQRIPYGWSYDAVLCHIAKLYVRGNIEIKENSNILDDNEVIKVIRNTAKQENLILQTTTTFSTIQLRQLKDFYKDFCNEPIADTDAKTIANKVNEKLKAKLFEVTTLLDQEANYPFVSSLTSVKEELIKCVDKTYSWYFNEFSSISENLLNSNDEIVTPIYRFMSGTGKTYYDEAKYFVSSQRDNLEYIHADYKSISDILSDMNCYKGNIIQQLRDKVAQLQQDISAKLEEEKQTVLSEIAQLREETVKIDDWNKLEEYKQQRFLHYFEYFEEESKRQQSIPVLKYNLTHFKNVKYVEILNQITEAAKPVAPTPTDTPSETPTVQPEKPRETIILASNVSVRHNKTLLATEADVEEYVENLRRAMLGEISDGKKIKI